MHCYDYEALVHDGAVYCTGCLPEGVDPNGEEVSPIFAGSEWDYYPTCDACGKSHEYVNLTTHGQRLEYLEFEPEDIQQLRDANDGKLPTFAWPGGYPILYLTSCNDTLCPDCANKHVEIKNPIDALYIHYEGEPRGCDECGAEIESAYGPVEENSNE